MARALRNLGIIAHIDAGKTTLTEQMLFQAGMIRRPGCVDDGDTTTDYLPQERERGITIVSAAVTFPWRAWQFNLIDTPGHVDFTMEVERSLRVLDGVVAVVDARAGVQSQTRTVWRQAQRHGLTPLLFINKLDKLGADWEGCLSSIERRLGVEPLPLQWPSSDGSCLHDLTSPELDSALAPQRQSMLERLAMHDEEILTGLLTNPFLAIEQTRLQQAIRRACEAGKLVPVLGGSALRSRGITALLDAIGLYLPAPPSGPASGCKALAFKVLVDAQKGPVTFVRVYEGRLERGQCLWRGERRERPTRLLRAFANSYEEVEAIEAGDIGVVLGLRHTRSGDTLTHAKNEPPLPGLAIPPPVIHCSVECSTPGEEERLEAQLGNLLLEDPSLHLHRDPDTGQLILAGMGELHLEIVRSRILDTAKIEAEFGPVRVSLREGPPPPPPDAADPVALDHEYQLCRELAGVKLEAAITLNLRRVLGGGEQEIEIKPVLPLSLAEAVRQGLQATLQSGPHGHPVIGVAVRVTGLEGDNPNALRMAAAEGLRQALGMLGSQVQEPIMAVTISGIPKALMGTILTDLHSVRRRGQLIKMGQEGAGEGEIEGDLEAEIPLACLGDYAAFLRSATGGEASLDYHFSCYRPIINHN